MTLTEIPRTSPMTIYKYIALGIMVFEVKEISRTSPMTAKDAN
ncbi:hypothetical protein CWATWH8502_3213 [Crocosphaera watsonii WH 8502]|uniref:Uncharacterized protein n=2 Tax=Crocosphaera watsonii TaxID=263511 RepID=T2JE24_CROWT|nr:hypothetical protein CWATWH8502_3213 [Crocosphaera watsonii WH 8502]CCQ63386.1 hypothetical protein CWATWH0401_4764 [Crocosphaera watsonii WH 0401]